MKRAIIKESQEQRTKEAEHEVEVNSEDVRKRAFI